MTTENSCRDWWWNGLPRKLWNTLTVAVLPKPFPRKHGEILPYVLSLHQQWAGTPFPTVSPHRWKFPSECWHNVVQCPSDSHWILQQMRDNGQLHRIVPSGQQGFLQPFWLKKPEKVGNPLLHVSERRVVFSWC